MVLEKKGLPNESGPLRLFKNSHQILCITGINFESKSILGYTELTIWPTVPDLVEIRLNSKQSTIFSITINKEYDAEFTYFDPALSIDKNNPIKRNIDYFHKQNKICHNSVNADLGNGEVIIKLPEPLLPTVSALSSFTVCVEFSVQQPTAGIHFVVPDMPGSMAERSAHMFTYAVENFSRMWFPCMDSFYDPCTWKIEVTVDKDMTSISCGDLVSVEYNEEMTEKTFHYFISTPVAAPNISLAVGPFEILVDPKMHEVTHFCLPGLMPVLKHTTSYIHQAFEFYEELMSSRYPYSYYKQVFVDMAYSDVATYSTMSILSTNLLHPNNIIDQTMSSRQLMATAVAQQFFGSFITMERWSDAWLMKGITGYLSYLFCKRTFGNNEYRHWVMRDLQEVCQYEKDVGPIVLDPSKQKESLSSSQHPFYLGSSHTLSPRYYDLLAKKARLIFRMLETRIGTELLLQVLNKLLSLAYNASQAAFNFNSWTNMLLSTASFLNIIYTVTGKDIEPFIDQWVYQGGCARFTGNFVFNRKRNVVELEIKQDLTAPGTLKFAGSLNVTIQELDGSFNHQFKIEENKTKFEITCHSKSRRNKKKKIPLMTGEEIDMDLSAMDAESPVLWLRLDPDLQLLRTVNFEQPDYMWQFQLKYERCIVAQFESIDSLKRYPTPASRYALNDTIENEECYYRVRQAACYCLSKIANAMAGTWTGPPAMITIFRKMFGSHSCPVIIRQNNFSNFHHYYLLKTMPQAMARLRDNHNLCLAEITKFLLDLLKYNDNSRNKWSDNYYRSSLLDALGATITPAITNVSLMIGQEVTSESLSSDIRSLLEEVVRCLNLEKLMPSYRFTVTVSCLHTIRTLQKNGHLPNESEVFKDYAQPGIFRDVRVAAVTCLVDFIKGDLTGNHLKWALDLIENDADPYIRHHTVTSLIENPPFRSSERSALNIESLVERLWKMLCKSCHDVRLCCSLADLYFTLYGRHRPSCLPQPEAVKLAKSEIKTEAEPCQVVPNVDTNEGLGVESSTSDTAVTALNSATDIASMAPNTSSIWNQELTSIFAPETPPPVADEAEVVTEEVITSDVDMSTPGDVVMSTPVKVEVEETLDRTPVDLTMISGETVVAVEESVITEEVVTDDIHAEKESDIDSDAHDLKGGTEREEKIKAEQEELEVKEEEKHPVCTRRSPSHLSEASLSPDGSPSRRDSAQDDVVSLDNIINSHASPQPPLGMFTASPKHKLEDDAEDEELHISSSPPFEAQASQKKVDSMTEEGVQQDITGGSQAGNLSIPRGSSSAVVEDVETKPSPLASPKPPSPKAAAPIRRRSQRSSSQLSPYGSSLMEPRKSYQSDEKVKQSCEERGGDNTEDSVDMSPTHHEEEEEGMSPTHHEEEEESPTHHEEEEESPTHHEEEEEGEETYEERDKEVTDVFDRVDIEAEEQNRRKVVEEIILDEASDEPRSQPQSPGHISTPTLTPSHTADEQAHVAPELSSHLSDKPPFSPPPKSPAESFMSPPPPSLSQQPPTHSSFPISGRRDSESRNEPRLSASLSPAPSPPSLTHHQDSPLMSPPTQSDTILHSPPIQTTRGEPEQKFEEEPSQLQSPPPMSVSKPQGGVTLKRRFSSIEQEAPSEEDIIVDSPVQEPAYKERRLVPPIKLSSMSFQKASGSTSGSTGQPSLKFKLGAAVAASEAKEREHHHHKSKKKKKKHKNKHKHKHRHREDREDESKGHHSSQGDTTSVEPQQRPKLLLNLSGRARMAVSDEDDDSSD